MPRWTSWSVQIRLFSAASASSSAVRVNVANVSGPSPVHWTSVQTCLPRYVPPLASFLGLVRNPLTEGRPFSGVVVDLPLDGRVAREAMGEDRLARPLRLAARAGRWPSGECRSLWARAITAGHIGFFRVSR